MSGQAARWGPHPCIHDSMIHHPGRGQRCSDNPAGQLNDNWPSATYRTQVQQRSRTAAIKAQPPAHGTTWDHGQTPAAPLVRDEEAAGSNPATPTSSAALQQAISPASAGAE